MRFSEAFGIERASTDDWFDIDLSIDTPLFVDPLLVYHADGQWANAHDELIAHFNHCYSLISRATGTNSNSARAARSLLSFPEPSEFGLGYTESGTRGSGSGSGYAARIADGIAVAIARGLDNIEHIEEIGMLNEGFGADRISDATCNVLKRRFIDYTLEIVAEHSLATEMHRVRHAKVDLELNRWVDADFLLPTNPVTGDPIILCPSDLLNELPTLNAGSWFDSSLNADLRAQMNSVVGRRISKRDIVEQARKHPERVRQWAREQATRKDLRGYDYDNDRLGVVLFDGPPVAFALMNPLKSLFGGGGVRPPKNQSELSQLIEAVLDQYARFIEHGGGRSLLWNSDNTEKPESAAQLVFLGMAREYLRLFDVELDREVDLGRGPVDFKVARGTRMRLLIEIKKAHNGRFWQGLRNQLPSYLISDDATEGWFVAIRYRSNEASAKRMSDLPAAVSDCAAETGKVLHYTSIDARPQASASKIG